MSYCIVDAVAPSASICMLLPCNILKFYCFYICYKSAVKKRWTFASISKWVQLNQHPNICCVFSIKYLRLCSWFHWFNRNLAHISSPWKIEAWSRRGLVLLLLEQLVKQLAINLLLCSRNNCGFSLFGVSRRSTFNVHKVILHNE